MNDRFGWLLRAEWTKFRTVRGWIVGVAAAAMLMVLFGLVGARSRLMDRTAMGIEADTVRPARSPT